MCRAAQLSKYTLYFTGAGSVDEVRSCSTFPFSRSLPIQLRLCGEVVRASCAERAERLSPRVLRKCFLLTRGRPRKSCNSLAQILVLVLTCHVPLLTGFIIFFYNRAEAGDLEEAGVAGGTEDESFPWLHLVSWAD